MKFLVIGSLNIDFVYRLDHIVQPGETAIAAARTIHPGGKGANQAAALARANTEVTMAGKIGGDGRFLLEELTNCGADTSLITIDRNDVTGHGIIQIAADGENAICIYPGTNHCLTTDDIERALAQFERGDILVMQNETNLTAAIMEAAHARGLTIAYNPAPFTAETLELPLELANILILNQIEIAGLTALSADTDADTLLDAARKRLPNAVIVLTLGSAGAVCDDGTRRVFQAAFPVHPVDTTGAGDTFIGFFLAKWSRKATAAQALETACAASALAVSSLGAMNSIPSLDAVMEFLAQHR